MTRRKFVKSFIKASGAVAAGTWWIAKKALPTKFVEAVPLKRYPGAVNEVHEIQKGSKWRG